MPSLLSQLTEGTQRRTTTVSDLEVRATDDALTFRGHAAVFNTRTWIGPKRWGFWEEVAPGAFARTIGEADVRFLINHDGLPLARSTSGTLRLAEDDIGLATEADLERTDPDVLRLVPKMQRGDVSQMSFAFEVLDEEVQTLDNGDELRILREVALWDVSVVTFPAYEETSASMREQALDVLSTRLGITTRKRARLIAGLSREEVDDETLKILREASVSLASLTSDPGSEESTQDTDGRSADAAGTTTTRRRRHALKGAQLGLTA